MKFLTDAIGRTSEYKELQNAVQLGALPAAVTGTASVHKANVIHSLCGQLKKTALVIAADESEAQRLKDDLTAMGLPALTYPVRDFSYRDTTGVSHEYERERLQVLSRAMDKSCGCVIACADAAVQFTLPKSELKRRTLTLAQGQVIRQEDIVRTLTACGYERAEQTEGTGQFSLRGGIIDFYSPSAPAPVRIEFWGDEIDTISYYDIESQRRTDPVPSVTITPSVEVFSENKALLAKNIRAHAASLRGKTAAKARAVMEAEADKLANGLHLASFDKYIGFIYDELATLFDYFNPAETLLFFSEPEKSKERIRSVSWQWSEDIKDLLEEGILCRGCDTFSEDWVSVTQRMEEIPTVFLDTFVHGSYPVPIKTLVNMDARQLSAWGGSTQLLAEDLQSVLERRYACVVLAGSERAARTTADELKNAGLPAAFMENISTVA
ncbi:MAG: transcription-repair coupling factor, partial [Clostridia bacterium]|nr:transcription-repair coupling factor [Clostridia bacterium]